MSPSRKAPPPAVVGLDIGSDSIKVAEAKFGKDGISITGLGIAATPEGAVQNEVIVDPKALGAAIKALLAESGIKTKAVVSSVSGQSRVVIRVIEVPKMARAELVETMKWEVERQVPFPPDQVVMDFQPLEKPNADPNAQNMEVLLAVAQSELISGHVEALQAAGLKPMAIDIEPLASSRALVETSTNGVKDQVVAIVNIGANNTDLGIFEGGVLTFPSPPLSIAGISFTREISEALGQTLEEAEVTKREYASVDLGGFGGGGASAQDAGQGAQSASEPTSFDTAIGPGFASVFDVDSQPQAAPADSADAGAGLAAEPAQLSDFQNTVDGPVFDSADPTAGMVAASPLDLGGGEPEAAEAPAGPSFDLGGEAPAAGPSFDLGGDSPSAGPSFDLGGDEPSQQPAGPTFDLDDEPAAPVADESANPNFDLSDADDKADPGEAVAPQHPAKPTMVAGSIEDNVFQAISGVLVDLANELRRSLEYYSNRYSQVPERIFLCGGTAKMPHLDEFLTRELGVPVEVADPIKNLNTKIAGMSDRYMKEVAPMFSVSIGLAIRDMIG